MAKQNHYNSFVKLSNTYFETLKKEYHHCIEIAQDHKKEGAHNIFQNEKLSGATKTLMHLLGNNLSRFFYEVNDACEYDKRKKIDQQFNTSFEALKIKNKTATLKQLAELEGINKMYSYWENESKAFKSIQQPENIAENKAENISPIVWQGQNETEFVQFIYALYEGDYIKNNSEGITKLVQQMAGAFNFKLSKNWQSKLSKSINIRNVDYEPQIFDHLKKSYALYRKKLVTKGK